VKKCESSILNEERKKILQSICKNINIANETDLNGLASRKGYEWKKQIKGSHYMMIKNNKRCPVPFHNTIKKGTLKNIIRIINDAERS